MDLCNQFDNFHVSFYLFRLALPYLFLDCSLILQHFIILFLGLLSESTRHSNLIILQKYVILLSLTDFLQMKWRFHAVCWVFSLPDLYIIYVSCLFLLNFLLSNILKWFEYTQFSLLYLMFCLTFSHFSQSLPLIFTILPALTSK